MPFWTRHSSGKCGRSEKVGLTRYVTRPTLDVAEAERWLEAARGMGFLQATVLREDRGDSIC